jgi:hypothetical protein
MFDRDGKPTGAYVYDVAVANGALELIADETRMFITRTETGKPDEFDNVTPRRGRREAGGGFVARDMTRRLRSPCSGRKVRSSAARRIDAEDKLAREAWLDPDPGGCLWNSPSSGLPSSCCCESRSAGGLPSPLIRTLDPTSSAVGGAAKLREKEPRTARHPTPSFQKPGRGYLSSRSRG